MHISPAGIALIQQFESCKLTAYRDQGGTWTIGWGNTQGVHAGMTITQAEADAMFLASLPTYENAVIDNVDVSLSQNEFDALVSFCYNVGPSAFAGSTVVADLNDGDPIDAADALLDYDHIGRVVDPGLTRRREAERALFLTPDVRPGPAPAPASPATPPCTTWMCRLLRALGLKKG